MSCMHGTVLTLFDENVYVIMDRITYSPPPHLAFPLYHLNKEEWGAVCVRCRAFDSGWVDRRGQ